MIWTFIFRGERLVAIRNCEASGARIKFFCRWNLIRKEHRKTT